MGAKSYLVLGCNVIVASLSDTRVQRVEGLVVLKLLRTVPIAGLGDNLLIDSVKRRDVFLRLGGNIVVPRLSRPHQLGGESSRSIDANLLLGRAVVVSSLVQECLARVDELSSAATRHVLKLRRVVVLAALHGRCCTVTHTERAIEGLGLFLLDSVSVSSLTRCRALRNGWAESCDGRLRLDRRVVVAALHEVRRVHGRAALLHRAAVAVAALQHRRVCTHTALGDRRLVVRSGLIGCGRVVRAALVHVGLIALRAGAHGEAECEGSDEEISHL